MSEITKGSILQSNAENEREEIKKVFEAVEKQYFKDIQNKAPVENIRFNEIILYALKEKLERENPKPLTIEELKQYKGKAIYTIENGSKIKKCEILCDINDEYIRLCSEDEGLYDCSIGTYTRTWLAYAYEPKEVE